MADTQIDDAAVREMFTDPDSEWGRYVEDLAGILAASMRARVRRRTGRTLASVYGGLDYRDDGVVVGRAGASLPVTAFLQGRAHEFLETHNPFGHGERRSYPFVTDALWALPAVVGAG